MGEIRIQDCADCGEPPVLTCDMKEGGHVYNIGHRCPDGTIARGARYLLRDEVIKEWNRQQIATCVKGKPNE
jgi:hypothetical protein